MLATVCFSDPVWLRGFALMSNVAFIVFGYLGAIHPITVLHLTLMPINGHHLARLLRPEFRARLRRMVLRPPRSRGQSTAQSLLA